MSATISLDNPQDKFNEINSLMQLIEQGFMAVALDYGYHIKNTFGDKKSGEKAIYEVRDNILYRLNSSKLHFHLLLSRKAQIETHFQRMLDKDPMVFSKFLMGNPYFEHAADEIMSIYDSVIFHLSSAFDYLAMLIQFVFGENPQKRLDWGGLAKMCSADKSEFKQRYFNDNIIKVDRSFTSKFNDYRAELIHRKKSDSYMSVSMELMSGKVSTAFKCSQNLKKTFKKLLDSSNDYCITYLIYLTIKESILNIGQVLEGMNNEFRHRYNPFEPVESNGAFQIISINPDTNTPESPSLGYWEHFMKYKEYSR